MAARTAARTTAAAADVETSAVNEIVLRTQAQAVYSPENKGHFGLTLRRYAHFTSPIRRYADLIVHRGLISALGLGSDGQTTEDIARLPDTADLVSGAERRAMAAERETIDRDVDANELSPLSHDPGPVAALEQQDRVQLLKQAMGALPETLRTAVLMRDIQELSYQEIADKLRLPEGTVKSRINRGRTELARQIRRLRGDDFGQSGTVLKRTGAN